MTLWDMDPKSESATKVIRSMSTQTHALESSAM